MDDQTAPQIRDIRDDLRVRINDLSRRRDAAERRLRDELQALDAEEATLKNMLALEEKRVRNGGLPLRQKPLRPGAANRTESEILEILSDEKEWPHASIKDALIARGIGQADDINFGRSLQGTLLSLRGRELVDHASERTWQITKKGLTGS
jgi:hypothetical protein